MALTDLTRISTSGIATGSTIDDAILRKDVSFRGSQVGVTSSLFDSSDDALEFNDNVKIKLGNGGDLELYHNGADNYIDAKTGSLYIRNTLPTNTIFQTGNFLIKNQSNNQNVANFAPGANGGGKLYHENVLRFNTTSTGAVVTGILTATSFSGGGGISAGVVTCTGLDLNGNGDVSGNFVIGGDLTVNGTTTTLDTNLIDVDKIEVTTAGTNVAVAVTHNGTGDLVRLYDGTSQVVTVDDEGKVGIGSAIPSQKLDVLGTLTYDGTYLDIGGGVTRFTKQGSYNSLEIGYGQNSNQNAFIDLIGDTTYTDYGTRIIRYGQNGANAEASILHRGTGSLNLQTSDAASIVFKTNADERLRIASDGSVGIGEETPDSKLDILHSSSTNSATENLIHLRTDPGAGYVSRGLFIKIGRDANYDNSAAHYDIVGSAGNSGFHSFEVQGDEKLRITKDGKSIIQKDAGSTNNAYSIAAEFNAKTSGSAAANFGPALYLTSTFGGTTYAGTVIASQSNSDVHTSDLVFYPRNYSLFEGLRIKSTGYVGIGTDNPGNNLDVFKGSGNDCTVAVRVKTAGAWFEANSMTSTGYYGLKFKHGNTKRWFFGSYGSNNLQLKIAENDASSLMEVTSDGKVGINTTSPTLNGDEQGIHIVSEDYPTLHLTNSTTGHAASNGSMFTLNDTGETIIRNGHASHIRFDTNNGSSVGERLRIFSDGRVQIAGQNAIATTSLTHRLLVRSQNDANAIAIAGRNGDHIGELSFYQSDASTKIGEIEGHSTHLGLVSRVGYISFATGGTTERLHISSGGKVTMGNVDTSSTSALHIRSSTSTETTLELSTKDNYNGSYPSAKIVFTQINGTEIARIKCDTETGAANMADLTFWTNYGGLYERMRVTKTGPVIIHSGSNAAGSLRIGGNYDSTGTTNATAKLGTLMMPHYTNAEEPIQMIRGYSDSSKTQISIGGGTSSANGATEIILNTSSSVSGTATERLKIDTSGNTTITGDLQVDGSGTSVRIEPTDGLINFGMDGRSSLVTGTNSCYIFSGSGASGDMPAGTLVLQSRSNVDRNILFATGSSAARKWHIKGSGTYGGRLQAYNSSNGNGQTFDFYRPITGALSTATSGTETTIITTNQIADAGAYVLILRSFEQAQTGGKLWSVRVVSSVFYIHSGSGNDGESLTIPVTYSGHHNSGTSQASNGHGPVTIKMHFYNGSAHTHGRITYTPNGFDYTGSNCDYYFYKLIDV